MRCRPGDLAIFIQATVAENIGRIVTVVRPAVGRERWLDEGRPAWIVTSHEPLLGLRQDGQLMRLRTGTAFDHHLQPIRGPRERAALTTEEEIHDHA